MLSFVCDVIAIKADDKKSNLSGFVTLKKMIDDFDSIPVKHQRPAKKCKNLSRSFKLCNMPEET